MNFTRRLGGLDIRFLSLFHIHTVDLDLHELVGEVRVPLQHTAWVAGSGLRSAG